MKTRTPDMHLALHPGETISLKSKDGRLLSVISAESRNLWLTRKGDARDYWLGAGDVFVLEAGDDITLSVEGGASAVALSVIAPCKTNQRTDHRNGNFPAWLAAVMKRFALRKAAHSA